MAAPTNAVMASGHGFFEAAQNEWALHIPSAPDRRGVAEGFGGQLVLDKRWLLCSSSSNGHLGVCQRRSKRFASYCGS